MTQVLMSRDNPDGWKLEELAGQLYVELTAKNKRIRESFIDGAMPQKKSDVLLDVLHNNQHIMTALKNIMYLQKDTMQRLDTLGTDKGPSAPRV
ncbi:hypothetical protein [Photobacterium sp. GSS17]|uniref:hypothetical protein n=1 Tax=Photobacterium sp. GSS17 TaxID=3020715 RepID=UPI0023605B29|nr:hypothetical protein [Photobacterium sp. GSS17]